MEPANGPFSVKRICLGCDKQNNKGNENDSNKTSSDGHRFRDVWSECEKMNITSMEIAIRLVTVHFPKAFLYPAIKLAGARFISRSNCWNTKLGGWVSLVLHTVKEPTPQSYPVGSVSVCNGVQTFSSLTTIDVWELSKENFVIENIDIESHCKPSLINVSKILYVNLAPL